MAGAQTAAVNWSPARGGRPTDLPATQPLRPERVVLYVLHQTQRERVDRNVPTVMLWGRVCEHIDLSPEELIDIVARLGARR
jgi:hypothetical protein